MLGVVKRSFPVATVCLEQRKAPGSVEGTLLSFEDAKAPWNMEVSPTVAAAVFCSQSKSKSREALLELLNACGVSPAARRLALDILMKLVLRESGKFDGMLFSKIIYSLAENRDSLLEYLVHKYFVYGGIRYHASIILNQVCSKEENVYGCSYDTDAIVDGSSPAALRSAFEAVFTTIQKAALERDKQLEHIEFPVHNELDSRDCDNVLFHGSKLKDESSEEHEEQNGRCKAKVPDSVMQEPDKVVTTEDLSSMIRTAARVRENDANNSKAAAGRKKSEEDEDDDDGDEEEGQEDDQGGGESGGDEGDSDEPAQGGNEEEEGEGEEEEENEEEDEDDEDEQQQQPPPPQPRLNLNNINNNGGGELDEDEEENDGGVEDDDDGGDGDGGDDEDEEDEEDPEVAPPKKKQRK